MGSLIKKVAFDKNWWSKFYASLKCQFVLFNSLCPRQMCPKCQYSLSSALTYHWRLLQCLLLADWEGNTSSGSHYWKLFRLWSDVRKLWPTTINYYAHNTIRQVTDQGQGRGVKQENLTSGRLEVSVFRTAFSLCTNTFLVWHNLPVSLSGNNWVLEIVRHMVMTPGGQRA